MRPQAAASALESRFSRRMLLPHILRSSEGENDGKKRLEVPE